MNRLEDIHKFYAVLDKLKRKSGYRYLGQCNGKMNWPKRGLYFFFEEGELREDNESLRIVRVGTHAVSRNSKTHLWNRLRGHRGNMRGKHKDGGNHRGSIFRLHLGTALLNRGNFNYPTWSSGSSAPPDIRSREYLLEIKVSEAIRNMPFLWLEADDEPGPDSIRKYIEKNSISLLSNFQKKIIDSPSPTWLGSFCKNTYIQKSGLWNVDHTADDYDPSFIDKLSSLVEDLQPINSQSPPDYTEKNFNHSHINNSNSIVEDLQPMNLEFHHDRSSLMILPCCAKKHSGGDKWQESSRGLKNIVSANFYQKILESRREVLSLIQSDEKYLTDKCHKNRDIVLGPDFGADSLTGQYMTAINRYKGSLYSASPSFPALINNCMEKDDTPQVLILSALYGPLHPFDLIQDYNLQMSDTPAYEIWKSIFSDILRDYVLKNSVKNIYLYFGDTTHYMKVAKNAVTPLKDKSINKAIKYVVENGSSYHTPHNHGVLIVEQLSGFPGTNYTRPITPKKL